MVETDQNEGEIDDTGAGQKYRWCKGCDREIVESTIPWCVECAPEAPEAGTLYEDLVP